MSATMQDAIAAARSGDTQAAQLLLAQYIQTHPEDAQGWYLMSQLVDSKARRAAYLNKTLALNPWHERAWAEYYSLPTEVINALEAAQRDQSAVPAGQLPDWLAPAAVATAVTVESASRVQRVTSAAMPVPPAAAGSAEAGPEPAVAAEPAQKAAVTPAAPEEAIPAIEPPKPAAAKGGNSGLTTLLIVLIVLTLLVLAFLIYLILQG
jgi:hypothetical protein